MRRRLFGTVAEKTGIVPFMELAERVMTLEPYASARRVYWVVDNGSSHRGQRSVERMRPGPTQLVHLPVHASWLNQIEVVFSVIQRKVSSPPTSPTSPPWPIGFVASRSATTPRRVRSTGALRAVISPPCSNASTPIGPKPSSRSPPEGAHAKMGR